MNTVKKTFLTSLFSMLLWLSWNTPSLARTDLDALRQKAVQEVLPHLAQLEKMRQLPQKDTAKFARMQLLLDIDQTWLQQAQFSPRVVADWVGYRPAASRKETIDLFEEYVHLWSKLSKVAYFFYRGDQAIVGLDMPENPTVILLNRSKGQLNLQHLLALSEKRLANNQKPQFNFLPTQKMVPRALQGEYISTTRRSIVEVWRTEAPAIFRDSLIKALDRTWKVYTAEEIKIPGKTDEMMYRILAFDKNGIPGYFTMKKDGRIWHFNLHLEQSDKLGQNNYQFQFFAKSRHLRERYLYFAILSYFVLQALFGWRTERKNRKLEAERDRANLALMGLRARLNPHFLFNTLGSIQDLMNQNNLDAANRYFSEMAELLRYVVDSASNDYVLLRDELNALEKYCSLEALRTPFDYSFVVDPEIDLDTEVPTMLLQPFVENAILHGLRPGTDPKVLLLKLKLKTPKLLVITIQDTGIGIEESRRRTHLLSPGRSHQGMDLTNQRIELLNMGKSDPIELEIQDRKRVSKQSGTTVRLYIPI